MCGGRGGGGGREGEDKWEQQGGLDMRRLPAFRVKLGCSSGPMTFDSMTVPRGMYCALFLKPVQH